MPLENANPVVAKPSSRLFLAGGSTRDPILSGLSARLTLSFANDQEVLTSWRIFSDDGFENILPNNQPTDGGSATAEIVFGTDTDTSIAGTRNFFEWVTNYGTQRRQFWVKNKPSVDGLYIDDQECQSNEATVFVNLEAGAAKWEQVATFAINVLPKFNDEFFTQQEYSGNRWANTRRSWGGVRTVAFFIDDTEHIPETNIEDFSSYYWEDPTYGSHTVKARLRSERGSATFVDINGTLRIRQIPCP